MVQSLIIVLHITTDHVYYHWPYETGTNYTYFTGRSNTVADSNRWAGIFHYTNLVSETGQTRGSEH